MKRMTIARLLLPENLIAAETARRKQAAANGEKAFNSAAVSSKKNVRPYDASKEAIAAPVKKKKRQVSTKGAGMERIQSKRCPILFIFTTAFNSCISSVSTSRSLQANV
mmetsp:Transcript_11441/g.47618  ORF Transcript_11441/g.47618 Transcript_11441/m.47618 type:complete len:109 (+) Transcript_11441:2134-2460(+)